jgi:hypothetical protein
MRQRFLGCGMLVEIVLFDGFEYSFYDREIHEMRLFPRQSHKRLICPIHFPKIINPSPRIQLPAVHHQAQCTRPTLVQVPSSTR